MRATLVAIRVNALDTDLTFADLEQTIACLPDCYVFPKVMEAEDVRKVSRRIAELELQHGPLCQASCRTGAQCARGRPAGRPRGEP